MTAARRPTASSSIGTSHPAAPRARAGSDGTGPRYPLTISAIGRNGKPADVGGFIFDTASKNGNLHHIATHGGTGRIRLPAGRYLIDLGGLEPPAKNPVDIQFFVPFRLAKRHTHLTLDARKTRPVTVSLDGRTPTAGQFTALAYWGGKLRTADFFFAKPGTLYVMPVHAAAIRFSSQWDIYGKGRAGTYQYVLAANHLAGVPAHPSYHFETGPPDRAASQRPRPVHTGRLGLPPRAVRGPLHLDDGDLVVLLRAHRRQVRAPAADGPLPHHPPQRPEPGDCGNHRAYPAVGDRRAPDGEGPGHPAHPPGVSRRRPDLAPRPARPRRRSLGRYHAQPGHTRLRVPAVHGGRRRRRHGHPDDHPRLRRDAPLRPGQERAATAARAVWSLAVA